MTTTKRLEIMHDPIEDKLYELATLAEIWKRNRDNGKPSPILRRATLLAIKELSVEIDNATYQSGPMPPFPI